MGFEVNKTIDLDKAPALPPVTIKDAVIIDGFKRIVRELFDDCGYAGDSLVVVGNGVPKIFNLSDNNIDNDHLALLTKMYALENHLVIRINEGWMVEAKDEDEFNHNINIEDHHGAFDIVLMMVYIDGVFYHWHAKIDHMGEKPKIDEWIYLGAVQNGQNSLFSEVSPN